MNLTQPLNSLQSTIDWTGCLPIFWIKRISLILQEGYYGKTGEIYSVDLAFGIEYLAYCFFYSAFWFQPSNPVSYIPILETSRLFHRQLFILLEGARTLILFRETQLKSSPWTKIKWCQRSNIMVIDSSFCEKICFICLLFHLIKWYS